MKQVIAAVIEFDPWHGTCPLLDNPKPKSALNKPEGLVGNSTTIRPVDPGIEVVDNCKLIFSLVYEFCVHWSAVIETFGNSIPTISR